MSRRMISGMLVLVMVLLMFSSQAFASSGLLRLGSRGSAVVDLQKKLNSLGYNVGKADGIFGSKTKAAVMAFQRENGLAVDGIVGPATWAKLNGSSTPSNSNDSKSNDSKSETSSKGNSPITQTLRQGSRGSQVKILQERLNSLGYNAGKADGIFGSKTKAAVIAFQRANGLAADGIVGPATRAKLYPATSEPKPSDPKPEDPKPSDPKPSNPPATSKPPITQTLRQGSRGSQVKILQERLNSLGYNAGTADGIFGSKTKAAVMAFQRANGLVVDGIVGPATIAKLYPPTSQPKPEEPKEDPKEDPKTGVVEYKPNPGELAGKIIIIDAGHGGSDSGAVWEDKNGVVSKKGTKYIEKEFNLDMALRLERILKQAGATVIMTRTTDTYYSLYYRSAFVNKFIVDLEIAAQEKIEQDLSADLDNKIAELDSKQEELGEKDQIEESINQLRNQITAKEEELIELEKESNLQQLKEKLANYISELKELGYDIQEGDNILEKIDSWIAELCDDEETNADRIQVLEDLKENIAEVISKITSIEAKIAELNELEGQKEALEEKLEYLKNLEEQIIPDLNAAIKARRDEKKEVEDLIADLKAKTGKLQTFLNNPSLNSRTGIYTYSSGYKVNEELKEIFNLTRAKYEDNIIFISIHCNASGSSGSTTTASGVQVYYRDNSSSPSDSINKNYYKSYNEEKRIKLAKALLKHTSANTNFKGTWSQPRIGDFHVIREHNLPSVLMEIGFVNNPQDAKLLSQPQTREDAAKGMYLGIVEYFKN